MYNVKSGKAEEFIDHQEILDTLSTPEPTGTMRYLLKKYLRRQD